MKKLSFGLVALVAIVFAVSSAFTTRNAETRYFVYGAVENLTLVAEQNWETAYTAEIPDQTEAEINPNTEEASPFLEEQPLSDFAASCTSAPTRVCLLSVKKIDGSVTDIIDVLPGVFQGF